MAGGKKKKKQGKAECEKKLERKVTVTGQMTRGFIRHERQCSLSLKAGGVCLTPRVKLSDSHFRRS